MEPSTYVAIIEEHTPFKDVLNSLVDKLRGVVPRCASMVEDHIRGEDTSWITPEYLKQVEESYNKRPMSKILRSKSGKKNSAPTIRNIGASTGGVRT